MSLATKIKSLYGSSWAEASFLLDLFVLLDQAKRTRKKVKKTNNNSQSHQPGISPEKTSGFKKNDQLSGDINTG